jgi:hypothetical protein
MDRPSGRELELGQRVARLEAEMAQLRAFVNVFRASMGQAPLQPPIPDVIPATVLPGDKPPYRLPGAPLIWVFKNNATNDQLASFKAVLGIPVDRYAIDGQYASVIVTLVFAPGGRADVTDLDLNAAPFAGKQNCVVVLTAGNGRVYVPAAKIGNILQFSFPLDDSFVAIRDLDETTTRKDLLKLRTWLKQNLGINARLPSLLPVLQAVGASFPHGCGIDECTNTAVYQAKEGSSMFYCSLHARQMQAIRGLFE